MGNYTFILQSTNKVIIKYLFKNILTVTKLNAIIGLHNKFTCNCCINSLKYFISWHK